MCYYYKRYSIIRSWNQPVLRSNGKAFFLDETTGALDGVQALERPVSTDYESDAQSTGPVRASYACYTSKSLEHTFPKYRAAMMHAN